MAVTSILFGLLFNSSFIWRNKIYLSIDSDKKLNSASWQFWHDKYSSWLRLAECTVAWRQSRRFPDNANQPNKKVTNQHEKWWWIWQDLAKISRLFLSFSSNVMFWYDRNPINMLDISWKCLNHCVSDESVSQYTFSWPQIFTVLSGQNRFRHLMHCLNTKHKRMMV